MKWLLIFMLGRTSHWLDGDQAYYDGKSEQSNPHPEGSAAWKEWRNGFYASSQ